MLDEHPLNSEKDVNCPTHDDAKLDPLLTKTKDNVSLSISDRTTFNDSSTNIKEKVYSPTKFSVPSVVDLLNEVRNLQEFVRNLDDDKKEAVPYNPDGRMYQSNHRSPVVTYNRQRTQSDPTCPSQSPVASNSSRNATGYERDQPRSRSKLAPTSNAPSLRNVASNSSNISSSSRLKRSATISSSSTNSRQGSHSGGHSPFVNTDGVNSRNSQIAARVGKLTEKNVSLLPEAKSPPNSYRSSGKRGGDLSPRGSQKSGTSLTSARTDGGVFSRLYQADYHKNREKRLNAMKEKQLLRSVYQFPSTTIRRLGSASRVDDMGDAVSESSMGSMVSRSSVRTDVSNISSRLYDPDYAKKREARLAKMREEREARHCTFAPTINHAPQIRRTTTLPSSKPNRTLLRRATIGTSLK